MPDPLPRLSLAQRASEFMANAIAQGEWTDVLPGERVLCERLEVSRPVLREALRYLEKAGVIACTPNQARRVLAPLGRAPRPKSRAIFLVGESLLENVGNRHLLAMTSEALKKRGMETDIRTQTSTRALAKTGRTPFPEIEVRDDTIWVLVGVSEATQRWFHQRRLPAVVAGSTFSGVSFSSLDIDYRAVGRHAAGELFRSGHRRIGFIVSDSPRAGDVDCEEGFFEGFRTSYRENLTPEVIRIRGGTEDICRKLKQVLSRKDPPTALLVCHAHLVLTVLTYVQGLGLRVPDDLSLVCRDSEYYLTYTCPVIAHYQYSDDVYTKLLARLILESASAKLVTKRILPQFVTGRSILTIERGN